MSQSDLIVEIENLRAALRWALAWISQDQAPPEDGDGEVWEDWTGATRLAWPDNPEEWD